MNMIRKLFSLLSALVLIAAFLFGLIMVSGEKEPASPAPVYPARIAPVTATDLSALTQAFGEDVPYRSLQGEGSVRSVPAGREFARMLTWNETDGLIVSAVQPAACAHLLRREGLITITNELWQVNGCTVAIAAGNGGACAYYQTEETAFSIYLPNAGSDQLLSALSSDFTFPAENKNTNR